MMINTRLTLLNPSQLKMIPSKQVFSCNFKRLRITHSARAARRPCSFIFHLAFSLQVLTLSCLIVFSLFRFTLALASYNFFSKFRSLFVSNAKDDKPHHRSAFAAVSCYKFKTSKPRFETISHSVNEPVR